MASRSNAIEELTRFWLESRHGCLTGESIPVPVPYALSDIDLVAVTRDSGRIELPCGALGPRIIVETKDEHDWEPTGGEFGQLLQSDIGKMGDGRFIPKGQKGVKFTMLRQEHYERARDYFDSEDFDRLFVVHAIAPDVLCTNGGFLAERRIHFVAIADVIADLYEWYGAHTRKAALRHTLIGDLWHLLVGFCGCCPRPRESRPMTNSQLTTHDSQLPGGGER